MKQKINTVSGPIGSHKTQTAISFAGHSVEQAGQKIVFAQPSINLIEETARSFRLRFPHVIATTIHSENSDNVARDITQHTKASRDGEVLFITQAALIRNPYWDRRREWHLIVDEVPEAIYHIEIVLPSNYGALIPALGIAPYNIKYSRLIAGDDVLLTEIAENKGRDQFYRTIEDFAQKLKSNRWELYVLNEQYEKFIKGNDGGRLLVFGTIDTEIFAGFASATLMGANLERSIFFSHLIQAGHVIVPHHYIQRGLKFDGHANGHLLTIFYATEANWSKYQRNKVVKVDDDYFISVNQLIVAGAMDVFGAEEFVKLVNKLDSGMREDPFDGKGIALPHSNYGLNTFSEYHNAAILPAINPTPALYGFLDEVSYLTGDEVRAALYHECVYQAAGRISLRNPVDMNPKKLVVADRSAAEAVARLYPNSTIRRLPFVDYLPEKKVVGRPNTSPHASDAKRVESYRTERKTRLLAGLDEVNGVGTETTFISKGHFRTNGIFGGSVFDGIAGSESMRAIAQMGYIPTEDFVEFLKDLHTRTVPKDRAFLWTPAEFDPDLVSETSRGLANITAMYGVWFDNDGGGITHEDFAQIFPHLMMIVYNTASSTTAQTKYRVVSPTTCALTRDAHDDIMGQMMAVLNRKGFYSKQQLAKQAAKGNKTGKPHGFDTSKLTASSMFYLPVQATAGEEHSFLITHLEDTRHPINPYQMVDRSIINQRPEPEPEPVKPINQAQADAMSSDISRHDKAIEIWRSHTRGSSNREFWMLAVRLKHSGIDRSEIQQILHQEAGWAHDRTSTQHRRNSIDVILKRLNL